MNERREGERGNKSRGIQICDLVPDANAATVDASDMDAGVLLISIPLGESGGFPGCPQSGRERTPAFPLTKLCDVKSVS